MIVAALAVLLFFYFRAQGVIPPEEPEVPEFSFVVGKTSLFSVNKNPRKGARRKTVQQIRGVLDRLYVAGFVDPAQWEDGFTGALRQFVGPTARQARRDLGDLTLGETAEHLELVTPDEGLLRLSLLYDRARRPVAAVAEARFIATGDLSDGAQVSIEHRGNYLLKRLRGRWAIVGYEVAGEIAERPVAATGGTPSPTGAGSPTTSPGATP